MTPNPLNCQKKHADASKRNQRCVKMSSKQLYVRANPPLLTLPSALGFGNELSASTARRPLYTGMRSDAIRCYTSGGKVTKFQEERFSENSRQSRLRLPLAKTLEALDFVRVLAGRVFLEVVSATRDGEIVFRTPFCSQVEGACRTRCSCLEVLSGVGIGHAL